MERYDVATDTLNPDYEPYKPGQALVNDATPQSDPDLFTDAELIAEMKYLLRLNKRHGTHVLRVLAWNELAKHLYRRQLSRKNV